MTPDPQFIRQLMLANPVNRAILRRLPELGIDQTCLTAGCLFQVVWNHRFSLAPEAHIRDYDVFYFDPDLSFDAEDRVIGRASRLFADLGVSVELRNQARVHLWYETQFGVPCPALMSSHDGIDRFPVACTCVGISGIEEELYAPFGLDELWHGHLRPNPRNPDGAMFRKKAMQYQARWPHLSTAPRAVTNRHK